MQLKLFSINYGSNILFIKMAKNTNSKIYGIS